MAARSRLPEDEIEQFFVIHQVVAGSAIAPELRVDLSQMLEEYRMAITNLPLDLQTVKMAKEKLAAGLQATELIQEAEGAIKQWEISKKARIALIASQPAFKKQRCYQSTEMQQVIPLLFVGSCHPANDKELLRKNGVTHVCCCIDIAPRFPDCFAYLTIKAADSNSYDISQHFESAFSFIDAPLLRGESVLVHCGAGISRAPTIVCAYLIRKLRISSERAIALVRSVRKCMAPNLGFQQQLKNYATLYVQ